MVAWPTEPHIWISVPWDAGRLSPNKRLHWGHRARVAKVALQTAQLAWRQAGSPRAKGRVRVNVSIRRGRVMDEDNALGGLKAVFDGLFKGCVTPDDSARWVTLGRIEQQTGKAWGKAPEVVFIIEEA
jgi:hypothetical protein